MTSGIFTSGSDKLGYWNDIKFIPFLSVIKLGKCGDAVLKALAFASCVWVQFLDPGSLVGFLCKGSQ